MTGNIVEFPDRRVVEEQAGAWLIRLDGDRPLSSEERASLQTWLGRSPVHREELENLATLWDKMNVLTELAVPLGRPERRHARRLRVRLPRMNFIGVTAVVVLVGLGVVMAVWFRSAPYLYSNGLYATAVGQQQANTLADGSLVLLNTDSQIKVNYSDRFRDIRLLQGEAHFTVTEDRDRPFRVFAGTGRVQAVGTAFSVYLKDSAVDVTVTEGKVALASVHQVHRGDAYGNIAGTAEGSGETAIIDNGRIEALATLRAGQSATIPRLPQDGESVQSALDEIETVEAPEMARRLSWREGVLTFSGDPLEAVVDEISRYTTISIEISDPAIRATRIGGRFPVGETDAMFDALETNFGLRVTRLSSDRVLLSAAED